jgi:hypothetical protein
MSSIAPLAFLIVIVIFILVSLLVYSRLTRVKIHGDASSLVVTVYLVAAMAIIIGASLLLIRFSS